MGVTGTILESCVSYTRIAAFSFLFSGISSAMTAAFQSSGRTRPLMYSGGLRSGMNILLDWLLIFGSLGFPRLGFRGAAVASVLSDLAGVMFMGMLLARQAGFETKPDLRSTLRAPLAVYGRIARMGIPTSLEELLWNLGNLLLIRFLNMLDPLATAVYSLVFTIEILPIVVFMSLGQTTTVLVGRAKGADDYGRAKSAVFSSQAVAWTASAALVALFAAVPAGLIGLFTRDPAIIARAAPILLISCFTFFPRSVNFMAGSGIRGLGNTRWMLMTQVAGTILVSAAGWILIFPAGLGVAGLFIAMLADEGIRAVANSVCFLGEARPRLTSAEAVPTAA
jgi:MATE family multidrug resistance protein